MKKTIVLSAITILLYGCTAEEPAKEPKNQEQVEQSQWIIPIKNSDDFSNIEVLSFEQYGADLTEEEIKTALSNYPQLAELVYVVGYIGQLAKPYDEETDQAALVWYAHTMQQLHAYMSSMTFKELSQKEQVELEKIMNPWLAKIKEVTNEIITKDEQGKEVVGLDTENELLGLGDNVMIISSVFSEGLSGKNNSLYGNTSVTAITKQGYEQMVALNQLIEQAQASYKQQLNKDAVPYDVKQIQKYYDYIRSLEDSPGGSKFAQTGEGTMSETDNLENVEQTAPILKNISGKKYVRFTEDNTKVREKPSIKAKIIYVGQKDDTVIYMERAFETLEDGRIWYEVRTENGLGYVSSKVATFTDVQKEIETNNKLKTILITGIDVNVRSAPEITSSVIISVEKGQSLVWTDKTVKSDDDRVWYEVIVGQKLGYVSSKFVKEE